MKNRRDEAREIRAEKKRQDTAAAKVTQCQFPECDYPAAKNLHPTNVLCPGHSFDVWTWIDGLGDPKALSSHQADRRAEQLKTERESVFDDAVQQPGWVYYLQIGDRIKIGYSVDVKRRMRAYPPDAKLLAVHPGTKTLEQEMHTRFAASRAAGREWFYPHADLVGHIEAVVAQFGDASRFAYQYRTPGIQRTQPRSWPTRR